MLEKGKKDCDMAGNMSGRQLMTIDYLDIVWCRPFTVALSEIRRR